MNSHGQLLRRAHTFSTQLRALDFFWSVASASRVDSHGPSTDNMRVRNKHRKHESNTLKYCTLRCVGNSFFGMCAFRSLWRCIKIERRVFPLARSLGSQGSNRPFSPSKPALCHDGGVARLMGMKNLMPAWRLLGTDTLARQVR